MTPKTTGVKICGLKDKDNLRAALDAGAEYVGLVFHPASPRFIDVQTAWSLAREVPPDVKIVGLFVNPSDRELTKILSQVKIDMIQLHGDEDPLRVIAIKSGYNLPVMKTIRVAGEDDLSGVAHFEKAADWLLFDTKLPPALTLPPIHGGEGWEGGQSFGDTGQSFDWNLLAGKTFKKPWMLSGGLNAENVKDALALLQPDAVDVSSGVENISGEKDPDKIRAFIRTAAGQ